MLERPSLSWRWIVVSVGAFPSCTCLWGMSSPFPPQFPMIVIQRNRFVKLT